MKDLEIEADDREDVRLELELEDLLPMTEEILNAMYDDWLLRNPEE